MTERRMRLLWPLGPLPLAACGGLVFAVTFLGTAGMYSWSFQEWERTSSEFMWQLSIAGPVAAAGATYYAGRVTPPSRIFAQRSSARPAGAVLRRHLSLLMAATLGGYLLAFAPLLWVTSAGAQHGRPDLWSIATGVAGLAVAVLLGYLVGAWGRASVLAPAAFVGVLGLAVAGTTGLSRLPPVPERVLALGEQPSAPLFAYRLVLLALIGSIAVLLSQHLLATTGRSVPTALVPALAVLLVAVAVPSVRQPAVSSYEADPPRVCQEAEGSQYCVHAGHRAQLQQFVEGGVAVTRAYGFAPPRIRFVHERALLGTGRPDLFVVRPSIEPYLPVAPDVALNVAAELAGTNACSIRYGAEVPVDVQDFTGYFNAWLLGGGEAAAAGEYQPFRDVPRAAVQRWIAANDRDIAACAVDLDGLPQ